MEIKVIINLYLSEKIEKIVTPIVRVLSYNVSGNIWNPVFLESKVVTSIKIKYVYMYLHFIGDNLYNCLTQQSPFWDSI